MPPTAGPVVSEKCLSREEKIIGSYSSESRAPPELGSSSTDIVAFSDLAKFACKTCEIRGADSGRLNNAYLSTN